MKKNSQLALARDKILGPGVLESNKTSLGEVRFVPNKGFLDFIVEGILASCTGTGTRSQRLMSRRSPRRRLKVASCTGTGEIAVRDTVEESKVDVKEESNEKIVAR